MLVLLRLAHALGIPLAWLLAELQSDHPLPPPKAPAAESATPSFLTPEDQAALLSLLGTTLREYRNQRHLSQQALADKTDLNISYISEIEGGTRNITMLTLMRLADALDFSVDQLFAVLDTYQRSSPSLPE